MLSGEEMELGRLRAVVESLAKSMDTLVMQNESLKRQLQVVELQQQLQLQHLQKYQHGCRVARGSKKASLAAGSSSGCSSWEFLGEAEQVDSAPSTPGPVSTTRWLEQELDGEESNSESGVVWVGCPLPQKLSSATSSASSTAESVVEERASDLAFLHLDLEAAAPAGRVGNFEEWSSCVEQSLLESPTGPPQSYGPPQLGHSGTTQLTVDPAVPIPFATATSSTVEANPELGQPALPPAAVATTCADIPTVPAQSAAASTTTWPFPFIGSMHGPVTIIVNPPGHGYYPAGSVKETSSVHSVHHTEMNISAPSAPATVFDTALPPIMGRPGCCCATTPARQYHAQQQPAPPSQDAKPNFFELPLLRNSSPWTALPGSAPTQPAAQSTGMTTPALSKETSAMADIIPPLFPSFGSPCGPPTINTVAPMRPCPELQQSKPHLFDSPLFDCKTAWLREESNDTEKKTQPASSRFSGSSWKEWSTPPAGPAASETTAGLFPTLSPFDSEVGLGKDNALGSTCVTSGPTVSATVPKPSKLGFDPPIFNPPSFESWLASHPLSTPLCVPEDPPEPSPWFGKWTSPGTPLLGSSHLGPFLAEATFPPTPGTLLSVPPATATQGSLPPPLNWVPSLRGKGPAPPSVKAKSTEKDWLPPLGLPDCKPLPGLPSPPSPPTCSVFSGPAPLGPIFKKSTVSRSAWSPQPRNCHAPATSATAPDASVVVDP
mmetsp:Transcript_6311/g.15147  ORF Transcript_6311/g.15147 Transcript_6311/m.15147 type:complete len:719 (-) Transcript_6311:115-2271(-)